jgi:hypothetical protein
MKSAAQHKYFSLFNMAQHLEFIRFLNCGRRQDFSGLKTGYGSPTSGVNDQQQ